MDLRLGIHLSSKNLTLLPLLMVPLYLFKQIPTLLDVFLSSGDGFPSLVTVMGFAVLMVEELGLGYLNIVVCSLYKACMVGFIWSLSFGEPIHFYLLGESRYPSK